MLEDDQGLVLVFGLRNEILISVIICACLSLGVCLTSITVCAQSSNVTIPPVVSLPPLMTEGPVPGGVISGYVLDEDGKPVSGAVVTLLQNGQVWQPVNYDFQGCTNPQGTNIAYSNMYGYLTEGSFEFGFLYPDQYTLKVEKDGYKSNSTDILIGNDTMRQTMLDSEPPHTIVNITLVGYHVPTLTQEQLSYSGSISGTLRNAIGTAIPATNVSLWQDGRIVNRGDNPQSSMEHNFSGKALIIYLNTLHPAGTRSWQNVLTRDCLLKMFPLMLAPTL